MADHTDELLDATTALIPPLLTGLEALAHAGRHLHPPALTEVVAGVAGFRAPLAEGLERFEAASWPEHLTTFREQSVAAAGHALQAFDELTDSLSRQNPVFAAYRALGHHTRAVEALYPVAFMLPPVNRFYLCQPERQDEALQAALLAADPGREDVGVMHADNGIAQRGGFSLYVPEYLAAAGQAPSGPAVAAQPSPLVVALHGGSGHGRRFLWTWLREARSRGAIVIAPTSREDTWSLNLPEADLANVQAMVEHVSSLWPVDRRRVLLTGMSDGGTFCWLAALSSDNPFTHFAPVSASFHPLLLEGADPGRLQGLPVYLVHGALDWMFPVDVARTAQQALAAAGARVTYRELDDLSHTYPREENLPMLDWLLATPA
ncbi:MAG: phospholipase [Gammaproteobacteria bacterium]|jgi:phospholipase/carboxylesterase|nr:phospholipase [Gammaproteobacteria bacterium]